MAIEPQTLIGRRLECAIAARLQLAHRLNVTTRLLRQAATNDYEFSICDNNTDLLLELQLQQDETYEAFLQEAR